MRFDPKEAKDLEIVIYEKIEKKKINVIINIIAACSPNLSELAAHI